MLTNLYNQRTAWHAHAHVELDAAVFAAYGLPAEMGKQKVLARLLQFIMSGRAGVKQVR